MPGLNIVYNPNSISPERKTEFRRKFDDVCARSSCKLESLYDDGNIIVTLISYFEGYPFRRFKVGDCHIFLEGYIFSHRGGDPIEKLLQLADTFGLSDSNQQSKIREFIDSADGEYLVALYDEKTGDLAVFNDILGRLPAFYCDQGKGVFISREIKFIVAANESLTLSRTALAEFLTFLFPTGERTLIPEIKKMLPANLLRSRPGDNNFSRHTLIDWNFSLDQSNDLAGAAVDELVDLYLEGIRTRVRAFGDREKVLALSGGLDSRTVMAGLMKVEEPFTAIIFMDHLGLSSGELSVAREIAAACNFDLQVFDLPGIDLDRMNRLIYMKDGNGANGIMGTVLRSHEIIAEKYGHGIVYHTGAGGGLILAPRCSIKSIKPGSLSEQIINRNTQMAIEDAASIARIDAREFRSRLNEYFLGYPEERLEDKYGHFMIFEHLFNFSYEGDDRERFFFWNSAPLYSAGFFKKAMKLGDISKMNHRLYSEFLKRLNPRLASIKYSNWGFPITSPLTPYYLGMKNWLLERPKLAGKIRKLREYRCRSGHKSAGRGPNRDAEILKNNISLLISNLPELGDYIETGQIVKLLPRWNNMYILYTVNNLLTYIKSLRNSISSLKADDGF
jgi:asparagine synthase (glutamine-hydrolysing)